MLRALPLPRMRITPRHTTSPLRPYVYHLLLAAYLPVCLWSDAHIGTVRQQYALGLCTFVFLAVATCFSPRPERRQVWCMVIVATAAELVCSLAWGLYHYRFHNVPLFVPPGHGLIYLFALRWARTPTVIRYSREVCAAAVLVATGWAVANVTLAPLLGGRPDVTGAVLLPVFLWFMRKPNAPVYAGAFVATSVLELVGTGFGNWHWLPIMPIFHLGVGNPPSVIAGGYCVLDYTAACVAPRLPHRWRDLVRRGMGRDIAPALEPA